MAKGDPLFGGFRNEAASLATREGGCQSIPPHDFFLTFGGAFSHMTAAHLTARRSGPLRGTIRAPGDKSISHRALILGALAHGVTEIEGLLEGDDVRCTAAAMAAFGAGVERLGEGRWRV